MPLPTFKSLIKQFFSYVIKRPLRNLDVDNRARKVLDSSKTRSAPRHASSKELLEDFARNNPQILEEQQRKPKELLERLKSVKVKGDVMKSSMDPEESLRSLPLDRTPLAVPEFGAHEPDILPEGKATLRQVVEFLTNHQVHPDVWTSMYISQKYKLDPDLVQQILENYKIFHYRFQKGKEQATISGTIQKYLGSMSPPKAEGKS